MSGDFEHFYNRMIGLEEPFPFEKQSSAMERRCSLLFEKIYAARTELARHSGMNMDEESPDVLMIVEAYEQMMRILSKYFYARGRAERQLGRRKGRKPRAKGKVHL
ncbi:MAG TPA: hypothetical protein VN512_05580 [Clostridia bacterium]|nr:hypothetical protein [Clostridia bacterium]